jgi:3-deoxy-D-manno-octulosonate 8-phosphate phosphatase (KDO 8-P phosphatase)
MADCPVSPENYPSDCEILDGYRTRARLKPPPASSPERKRALARARDIEVLLLDVDGVLTNGNLLYSASGEESKAFNTQDGFGLRLLKEAGVGLGVITARQSAIVTKRSTELKMDHIYQGISRKREALQEILKKTGVKPFQIAYMGDDWLDLPLLNRVGLALAPANAVVEVREVAHYVTTASGGAGAVREACTLILEAKNLLATLLQNYLTE